MIRPTNIILTLLLICAVLPLAAQDFRWEADLEQVSSTGFYDIPLNPEITAKLNNSFADIRIYDSKNIEIPYVQRRDKPVEVTTKFRAYKIVSRDINRDKNYSRIVVENPDRKLVNNLQIIIKNAEVSKWLSLTGSDDNKTWYALKDHYRYTSFVGNTGTSVIKVLNFPPSNYKYFELKFFDYFDAPINVEQIGYFDTEIEEGVYSRIAQPTIVQTDSVAIKSSIITARFAETQYVDRMKFVFDAPAYYLRSAQIMVNRRIKRKRKTMDYKETVDYLDLSSYSDNTINLNSYPLDEFYISIQNNDNQPLKLKEIIAYQLNTYLTAELQAGTKYTIRFGSDHLAAPVYDLKYFVDSIPKNRTSIVTKTLRQTSATETTDTKNEYHFVIWIVLALVVVILGVLSYKMLEDMRKK